MKNEASFLSKKLTITPTIVIGLGGSGSRALSSLKKIATSYFDSNIPVVKFLSFDTDILDEGENHSFSNFDITEFHQLMVEDIQGLLDNKFKHPSIFTWFPHEIDVAQIKHGANQMRQLGRLALFWNIEKVTTAIDNAIKSVGSMKNRTLTQQKGYTVLDGMNFYILSSTCGGTGSGMVLDFAYLLRHFKRLSDIIGVLFLPSAFHIEQQKSIDANGFATLTELEYYNKTKNYTQDFGHGIKVSIEGKRPFDRTYLIDSWNETERHMETIDNVCQMSAETLFSKIFLGIYEKHRSIVDNLQYKFNKVIDKRTTAYSSFGHSSLYFNHERFISLLTHKKMKNILYDFMGREKDVSGDVLLFLEKNQIDEELTDDLIEALRIVHGEPLKLSIDINSFERVPLENIPVEIEKYESDFSEKLESGFLQMKKNHTKKLDSLKIVLKNKIKELLVDHEAGLKYSRLFLEEFIKKITLFIDILDEEIESKYKKLKKNTYIGQKKKKLNDLLGGFLSFFFKKSEIFSTRDEVISEINKNISYDIEIYSRELAIEIYENLADLSEEFLKKIGKIEKIFTKTQTIIKENYEVNQKNRLISPYITDIEILSRESFVETIFNEFDFDTKKIEETLFSHSEGILSIAKLNDKEFYTEFYKIVNNFIKNDGKNSFSSLIKRFDVLRDKMKFLMNGASPFWRYSKVYFPTGVDPDEIIIVAIQKELEEYFRNNFPNSSKIIFVRQVDDERIQVFRFKHGIPLISLNGVRGEYKSSYELVKREGRSLHILSGVDKVEKIAD